MSIDKIERSRAAGVPFELYEFIYGEGEGDVFTYTDALAPVSLAGKVYEPAAITRDAIKSKGRQKNSEIRVTVSRSLGVAGLFRGYPPRRVIFLRIYAGFLAGDNVPSKWAEEAGTASLRWSGRILESAPSKGQVNFTCDTLGAGMSRPGLTRFYQRECPFVLYGPRCQANRAAASTDCVVVEAAGSTVTLDSTWADITNKNKYVGGLFEWTGSLGLETRMIVSVNASGVILDGPVVDLEATDAAKVVLGCGRVTTDCVALHDNIVNFGGMPYIPIKNPLNKNNHT